MVLVYFGVPALLPAGDPDSVPVNSQSDGEY